MNKEEHYVETPFLDQLESLGWEVIRQKGIPQNPGKSLRASFRQVALEEVFKESIKKINTTKDGKPWLSPKQLEKILEEIVYTHYFNLLEANEDIFKKILGGFENKIVKENHVTGTGQEDVKIIDFENPTANRFIAVSQFRIDTPGMAKEFIIPDIVLFINGLPIVVVECKYPDQTAAEPLSEALRQLFRYSNQRSRSENIKEKEGEEHLFYYNQIMIATSGKQAAAGTITSHRTNFMEWKDIWPTRYRDFTPPLGKRKRSQEILVQGMLPPDTLLDIIRHFILFREEEGKRRIKILCYYHQYRAVQKAIQRLLSGPTHLERSGVIWHAQGAGKSITMVFLARKMRTTKGLSDYKIIFVNDRVDLEDQLKKNVKLIGENFQMITSTKKLKEKLSSPKSDISMVMMHKFIERKTEPPKRWVEQLIASPPFKDVDIDDFLAKDPLLYNIDTSGKILIMVDEAHRSQGKILNRSMNNAFPNAAQIGFTGTPLITDRHSQKTVDKFGAYIDIYTLKDSVKDGATREISYIGRTAKAALTDKNGLERKFEDLFRHRYPAEIQRIKKRYGILGTILEADKYIKEIAKDLVDHYVDYILPNGFKAQVVTHSQIAAVRYRKHIRKAIKKRLQLEKQSILPKLKIIRSLEFLKVAVVISGEGQNEPPEITRVRKEARELGAIENFKKSFDFEKPNTGIGILVVCDMLLTGFDAPIEQVMYINKRLKEHNLLQAIARVNRPAAGKNKGFILDYIGFGNHLREALEIYAPKDRDEIIRSLPDFDTEIPVMQDRYHRLLDLFKENGVTRIKEYVERQITNPELELEILEKAIEILEDIKIRAKFEIYYKNFLRSLDVVFPHSASNLYLPAALAFGHILNRLKHRYRDESIDFHGVGNKIRSLVDEHLVSLGINPVVPPIDILSPEFEKIVKDTKRIRATASEMEHAIRKHIKVSIETDPVFYQKLSDRLEEILKRYNKDVDRYKALLKLFEEIKTGRAKSETGLDPIKEMPFYDQLLKIAFGSPDFHLSAEQKEKVIGILRKSLVCINNWIRMVGFWDSLPKQRNLKKELGELFLLSDIPGVQEYKKRLVTEFTALAKKKHHELIG